MGKIPFILAVLCICAAITCGAYIIGGGELLAESVAFLVVGLGLSQGGLP